MTLSWPALAALVVQTRRRSHPLITRITRIFGIPWRRNARDTGREAAG